MEIKDKIRLLNDCYNELIAQGKIGSKKDLAALIGVHHTTLSSAFNGNPQYCTDALVSKVSALLERKPERPARQITIPEETLELYTNLSETCRNLSAILARMGLPTGGLGLEGYGTKKDHLLNNEG
jgi:hypothetical protein